jgi:hypothetical protein
MKMIALLSLALFAPSAHSPETAPEVQARLAERENSCVVEFEGKTFSLPRDQPSSPEQKRLEAELATLSARKAKLHIAPVDPTAVSYRCFGGLIYLAQKAGLSSVGFVSEPPPK